MNLSHTPLDLRSLGIGESGSIRATGLHASDLYGSLYQQKEPDRYRSDGEPPPPLLLETGLTLENMLEEGLARKFATSGGEQIARPGEFTHSDVWQGHPVEIHYNPDLFIYNGVGLRIGEIKGTWLSSKIPQEWTASPEAYLRHAADIEAAMLNPKLDKYYTQIKFYCYMTKTRFARLYTFFIAGDYTRPFKSQMIVVDIEFSQDELDYEYATLMWHGVSTGLIGGTK